MSENASGSKFHMSLIIFVFGSVAAVAVILSTVQLTQKAELSKKILFLSQERDRLTQKTEELKRLLSDKEQALAVAEKKNFQAELMAAQTALRDVNEKLSGFIGQKANLENMNAVLDSRLKSTSTELTRSLEELRKAREILGGIENQYKMKMSQLEEKAKAKDIELQRFQDKLKEKDAGATDFQKREQETADSLKKYRLRVADLEKSLTDLNRSLSEKERELAQVRSGAGRDALRASYDKERTQLENQIAEASAKLFDQQDKLRELSRKVVSLTDTLTEKETALAKRESELKERAAEVLSLKDRVYSLRSASSYSAETGSLLTQSQRELEEKVRMLEKDKEALQEKLYETKRGGSSGSRVQDAVADRDVRILTQTLVKKEEQIKALEIELNALKSEKLSQGAGAGVKERKLQELEILVSMLTKQLGEYASLLEKKDADLKAAQDRVALLTQEVEAQKVASSSLQKELMDSKARQDKTFQSLTQIMGMNSVSTSAGTGGQLNQEADQEPMQELNLESVSVPENFVTPENTYGATGEEVQVVDEEAAKKRVEELKRRVEVLLQSK